MALNYLGSMNLADSANTYNLVPEAVRAGDMLIERWQRSGIGHTLVVKEVAVLGEGNLDVTTISGSMPRRQGKRESGVASKSYFTSAYAGGPGANPDGVAYARLGGGAKRFRVAKNVGGFWTNTWARGDEAHWINSTDDARIAARPARFEQLLGQVAPAQQRAELVAQIADARRHLRSYPASCSARERREAAFAELYDLSERAFGQDRAEVDPRPPAARGLRLRRADLHREQDLLLELDDRGDGRDRPRLRARRAGGGDRGRHLRRADGVPGRDGDYDRWADHAAATGRAALWRAWSEDESCPQRGVDDDAIATNAAPAFCSAPPAPSCADGLEPNDSAATAAAVGPSSTAVALCPGDADWYRVAAARTVTIRFRHADGDLDLVAYDAAGARVATSDGITDQERVAVPAGGAVQVIGYGGATNAYTLIVE
jgi:hypothetical protein